MSRDETLVRVSEGRKVEGFKVVEFGLDASGKYKGIETPEGDVEKVYCMGLRDLEKIVEDKYNRLHRYRREGDKIVLYYNTNTEDVIVLALKSGDNLGSYPFNLGSPFVVDQKMLEQGFVGTTQGVTPINKESLRALRLKGILSEEMEYVLMFNKKNVGFYF